MTISTSQFPQKLQEGSCIKVDFTGVLQSENIRIYLFEISWCFYYFVQPLYLQLSIPIKLTSLNIALGNYS